MSNPIIKRVGIALLGAVAAVAQVPAAITLAPSYVSGSRLLYAVAIHSAIGAQAAMDTSAEVEMKILPGATPGHFETEMRFTRYATTVKADAAAVQASLTQQASATDQAALKMKPVQFRVDPQQFEVLARTAGADYDQPVEMLEELARIDDLPGGPIRVGDQWTRQRSRAIPTLNFSVALTLQCALTAVAPVDGRPTATITIHSHGSTPLPPGSLPGSQEMATQGLVPEANLTFDTNATSQYRVADAVLLGTTSETHNLMHIRFVGPSPQAQTTDTDISSTSTVKLESVTTPY